MTTAFALVDSANVAVKVNTFTRSFKHCENQQEHFFVFCHLANKVVYIYIGSTRLSQTCTRPMYSY